MPDDWLFEHAFPVTLCKEENMLSKALITWMVCLDIFVRKNQIRAGLPW